MQPLEEKENLFCCFNRASLKHCATPLMVCTAGPRFQVLVLWHQGFVALCFESHKPDPNTHPVSLAPSYLLENTRVFLWMSDLVLKWN